MKVYYCEKCGALYFKANDHGDAIPSCCGQETVLLEANTTDAATEKHVPVIERDGNKVTVTVGETLHPMEEDHWITMIAVVQNDVVMTKALKPGDEPKAEFYVGEGKVEAYEHCNKHGLWKAEA